MYFHIIVPDWFILVLIRNNMWTKCSWTDFRIIKQTVAVHEKEIVEPFQVAVGSNVNLTCQTSRAFEYCTWRHMDKECKFEWKRVRLEFKNNSFLILNI